LTFHRPKTEEEAALSATADALVASLLPGELCACPTGPLLSALLAHGALGRALSLVADPGWLQNQIAWALGAQTDTGAERILPLPPPLPCIGLEEGDSLAEGEATPEYEVRVVSVLYYFLIFLFLFIQCQLINRILHFTTNFFSELMLKELLLHQISQYQQL